MSEPENPTPEPAPEYGAPQRHEQPAVEESARLGPLLRLTGALFSAGETFADVNRKPTWLTAMIIVMLTGFAASVLIEWRVKPDWERFFRTQTTKALERSGRSVPPEQIDQQIAMQVMFARTDLTSPLSLAVLVVKLVIYTILYCVVPAGVFALGLMLIQAKTTFKKILSVVAWSTAATGLVGAVVFFAALMVRDQEGLREINPTEITNLVPTNLGVILPSDTSPFLGSIAASLDIFSIWLLILFVLGFTAIAGARKITRGKIGTIVVSLWLVWVLIKAGAASVFFAR